MFLIRIQIIFLIALSFLFSQDETRDEDVTPPELLSLSFSLNLFNETRGVEEYPSQLDITLKASSISSEDSIFKILFLLKLLFLFIKKFEYFHFDTSELEDIINNLKCYFFPNR